VSRVLRLARHIKPCPHWRLLVAEFGDCRRICPATNCRGNRRLLSPVWTGYKRSFHRRVFPGNHLPWYWQLKTNKRKYTKNTKQRP